MSTTHFTTSITVSATPAEVYSAISNVRGWWQGEITGGTDKLNDEFSYRYEDLHFSKQKIAELIPGSKVVWLVTESDLSFTEKKDEWTGTKIIFEISESDGQTHVQFTHEGLNQSVECYADCSAGWTGLIRKSLVSLITSGKGEKVF